MSPNIVSAVCGIDRRMTLYQVPSTRNAFGGPNSSRPVRVPIVGNNVYLRALGHPSEEGSAGTRLSLTSPEPPAGGTRS